MTKSIENRLLASSMLVLVLMSFTCGCSCPSAPPGAGIQITSSARQGAGGPTETDVISGTVVGVNPGDVKILIYAHAGDNWWVQPFENAPFTTVSSDLTWQATIHLGYEYAAFLVHKSYSPSSPKKRPTSLDPVGGCVWAVATKAART